LGLIISSYWIFTVS